MDLIDFENYYSYYYNCFAFLDYSKFKFPLK